jgi:hypothetical protein
LTGEFQRTSRKTCPSATLTTTNPTWLDPGANRDSTVRERSLTARAVTRPEQGYTPWSEFEGVLQWCVALGSIVPFDFVHRLDVKKYIVLEEVTIPSSGIYRHLCPPFIW